MTGLTFKAWRENAYIWLPEVVSAVLPLVATCNWKAALEDWTCPDSSESELEALQRGRTLNTAELLRVFASPVQVIDGEVAAYEPAGDVVAVLRAVDSTWWDVLSDRAEVLAAIRSHFPDATALPD